MQPKIGESRAAAARHGARATLAAVDAERAPRAIASFAIESSWTQRGQRPLSRLTGSLTRRVKWRTLRRMQGSPLVFRSQDGTGHLSAAVGAPAPMARPEASEARPVIRAGPASRRRGGELR